MASDSTIIAGARPGEKPESPRFDAAATKSSSQAEDPGRLQTGCVIANRFVIQKFLSKGGMGDVYEAEDLHLNQARVALKTIRPEYVWSPTMRNRFRQEVLLARSISHPNVCPVYEMFSSFGPEGEIWFLTMKLLSGETLANRLHRLGPLAASDAVRFAQEIASALDTAHTAGVIHRDLKPGNIFLESHISGVRAVVTDFGLARNWSEGPWSADAGATVVGTPPYIAPEILGGGGIADPKSDLYSFGIILHEMIWGSRPAEYEGEPSGSAEQRMHKVVIRCIYADPALRYASAGAAAEALTRAWNGGRRGLTRRELMLEGAAVLAAGLLTDEWGIRNGRDFDNLISPVPRPRRVAVLPAKNQALPIEEASLMSGIVDSLGINLARAETSERDLFVVPPSMVREQKLDDPSKAAGLFGANLVLRTSLIRKPREIEVALQLMDCTSGKVIRKGSVTCAADSVYELPALATERAATLLDVKKTAGLAAQIAKGGTDNPEAFLAYERGRENLRKASPPDVEQAITELEKAVEFDAQFALAYALLAEAYVVNYRHTQEPAALEMADENVRRCRALAPNLARGNVSQALIEGERGDYGAAESDLKKAIALDPDDARARLTLAETYHTNGKTKLASATYEELLRQHPNLWPALMDWANLQAESGDFQKAEQLFKRATVAAPNAFRPWNDLGGLYLYLGQLGKAEAALNQSLKLFPSGPAYNNLGMILFWQSRFKESTANFEKAVALNPRNALMWGGLGDAYAAIPGKRAQAVSAWNRAVSLESDAVAINPNGRDQITNLALYQAKSGNRSGAQASLARANKLHSPNLDQLFTEACTHELIGDRDLALQQTTECLRRGYSRQLVLNAPELASLLKDPRARQLGLPAVK